MGSPENESAEPEWERFAEALDRDEFLGLVSRALRQESPFKIKRPLHTQVLLSEDPTSGLKFITKSVGNGEKCEVHIFDAARERRARLWAFREGRPEEGLRNDSIELFASKQQQPLSELKKELLGSYWHSTTPAAPDNDDIQELFDIAAY